MVRRQWQVRAGGDLGRAIAEIRYSHGMTQAELAQMLNIDRTRLAKLERGHSTQLVDLLIRLLRMQGATLLVEFDDPGESPPDEPWTGSPSRPPP